MKNHVLAIGTTVLLFVISSNVLATSTSLTGSFSGTAHFGFDTLLISGDCNFDTIIIDPGTTVEYLGNFHLEANYIDCRGTDTDSVTFLHATGTDPAGSFHFPAYLKQNHGIINNTRFINLKSVSLGGNRYNRISDCDSVMVARMHYGKINNNRIVYFEDRVEDCQVSNNTELFYLSDDGLLPTQYEFNCHNNTFTNNGTGLQHGNIGGDLFITNNNFIGNAGTVFNYISPDLGYTPILRNAQIENNLFEGNSGDVLELLPEKEFNEINISNNEFIRNAGLAINIHSTHYFVRNNLFVQNISSSGPGAIQISKIYGSSSEINLISNNTFIENHGNTYACISIKTESSSALNLMANNIFHGNTANHSSYTIGCTAGGSAGIVITHSAFDEIANITQPNDGSFTATITDFVFSDDPQFIDAGSENYRLSQNSPYLNNAVRDWVHYGNVLTSYDLDGNTRILGATVDMGAYETTPTTLTDEYAICNGTPITIDTQTENVPHLWSTGETTQSIVVDTPGDYWVEIGNSSNAVRYDMPVDDSPGTVELSGEYFGTQHFLCADTLLIVGDCQINDTLILDPGTHVIFDGSYTLSTYVLIANGTEYDSIYFKHNKNNTQRLGTVNSYIESPHRYCYEYYCRRTNSIQNVSFSNIDTILISQPRRSSFNNCNYVKSLEPVHSKFNRINIIISENYFRNCLVSNCDSITTVGISSDPGRVPSTLVVDGSTFSDNNGTLNLASAYVTVSNNVFQDNNATAVTSGTGIYEKLFHNNLFINNNSTTGPGAMEITNMSGPVKIYNNTFYGNSGNTAATIGFIFAGYTFITNNIFWDGSSISDREISFDFNLDLGTPSPEILISHNTFQNGLSSIINQPFITFEENVSFNPEFVDSNNYNLHLSNESPLIDKGDSVNIPFDLDGNPRRLGTAVDIGAYETFPRLFRESHYICEGGTLRLDTETREPYRYLSPTIEDVAHLWSTGETRSYIDVTEPGNYWVEIGEGGGTARFDIEVLNSPNTVEISGTYPTPQYFCADTILVVGNCQFLRSVTIEPGAHVIYTGDFNIDIYELKAHGAENDSIYFEYNGSEPAGSLYCYPQYIRHQPYGINEASYCSFRNLASVQFTDPDKFNFYSCNYVKTYSTNGSSFKNNNQVYIDGSTFNSYYANNEVILKNFVSGSPGGCSNYTTIQNSTFINNSGSLITAANNVNINHSKFIGNSMSIYIDIISTVGCSPNSLTISNNLFYGNVSDTSAGAIHIAQERGDFYMSIYNNTIVNNSGALSGGIYLGEASDYTMLVNNILWGNHSESGADAIQLNEDDTSLNILLYNNIIQGGINSIAYTEGLNLRIEDLIEDYPNFIDTLDGANLSVSKTSVAIDNGGSPEPLVISGSDIEGNPRKFGQAVDIGAFEYIPTAIPQFSYVTADTAACENDALTLKAYSNDRFAYNWYKDGVQLEGKYNDTLTIPNTTADDLGYYKASISSLDNTLLSDSLQLQLEYAPLITNQNFAVSACENAPAEFWVDVDLATNPTYQWSSAVDGELDETSNTYRVEQAKNNDTLVVEVSSACGSVISDNMVLTILASPQPNLGNDTVLARNDSLLVDAGVFNTYSWNTGSTEAEEYAWAGDTLHVTVSDANGCAGSDTIIIGLAPTSLSAMANNQTIEVMLYPNPANEVVYLHVSEKLDMPYIMSIYNEQGKLMVQEEIFSPHKEIEIGNKLQPGGYFIKISANNYQGFNSFIMQ